jgi:hypothetical protein
MLINKPLILSTGTGATPAHTIDQSIRFNDGDSPYLQKTYSGAGSRTTFTFSVWAKLGDYNVSSGFPFFNGGSGTSDTTWGGFGFYQGKIYVQGFNTNYRISTRILRDPSAWYHIVYVWDTTNAVADERVRVYVNGVRLTDFSTYNNPGASANSGMNQAAVHTIGYQSRTVGYGYADALMAEIVFLDGTATDCNSFGEFNSSGIWIPKDVSGLTFGTNGFHIDGRDSADLGDDESGQGNDYTASGLAAHDQVFDTPTNNFCVLNPVDKPAYGSYAVRNVTGVNLQVTENGDGVVQSYGMGTMVVSSGKWYYEIYTNTYPGGNALAFGWIELENAETATDSGGSWKTPGINQRHTTSAYSSWTWGLNNQTATGLTPFGQGVTIGVTTDFDNNTITLTKDGSAYGSVDFDSTSPTYALSGVEHKPILFFGADGASLATLNFGQDSTFNGAVSAGGNADGNGHGNFKYAVPSGALALCTKNLGS